MQLVRWFLPPGAHGRSSNSPGWSRLTAESECTDRNRMDIYGYHNRVSVLGVRSWQSYLKPQTLRMSGFEFDPAGQWFFRLSLQLGNSLERAAVHLQVPHSEVLRWDLHHRTRFQVTLSCRYETSHHSARGQASHGGAPAWL